MFTLLFLLMMLCGTVIWFPLMLIVLAIWIICSCVKHSMRNKERNCSNYCGNWKPKE